MNPLPELTMVVNLALSAGRIQAAIITLMAGKVTPLNDIQWRGIRYRQSMYKSVTCLIHVC